MDDHPCTGYHCAVCFPREEDALDALLDALARPMAPLEPGTRIVEGRVMYSADWL